MAASYSVCDLLPERMCRRGEPERVAPKGSCPGARRPSTEHVSDSDPDGVSLGGLRRRGATESHPVHPGLVPVAAGGYRRVVGSQLTAVLGDEGSFVYDCRLLADSDRLYAVQTNLWLQMDG